MCFPVDDRVLTTTVWRAVETNTINCLKSKDVVTNDEMVIEMMWFNFVCYTGTLFRKQCINPAQSVPLPLHFVCNSNSFFYAIKLAKFRLKQLCELENFCVTTQLSTNPLDQNYFSFILSFISHCAKLLFSSQFLLKLL